MQLPTSKKGLFCKLFFRFFVLSNFLHFNTPQFPRINTKRLQHTKLKEMFLYISNPHTTGGSLLFKPKRFMVMICDEYTKTEWQKN